MNDILLEIKINKDESYDLDEVQALKNGQKVLLNPRLDCRIADALLLVREGRCKCSFAFCRKPLDRNSLRMAISYPISENSDVFCFHETCCKGSLQEVAQPGEYSLESDIN